MGLEVGDICSQECWLQLPIANQYKEGGAFAVFLSPRSALGSDPQFPMSTTVSGLTWVLGI